MANATEEKKSISEDDLMRPPKVGEMMKGTIIGVGRSAVYVDLGIFGVGVIYGREFYEAKEMLKDMKIGDEIFAKIIDLENEEGYVELSVSQASSELTWEKLKQKKESGEIIKVKILKANKGGLLTEISGIPGFLPVSQLSPENYPRVEGGDAAKITKELQKFIGQELEVKIFDVDSREDKLILSEKAKEDEKIKEILENYNVGDAVEGEITGIVDFGAFVKFGKEELEGLIHISELDWQLIEDPAEIVSVGDKVKAKIIEISDNKVSLSLKALKKDPWLDIEEQFQKRDVVKGTITKFNPYGAFVKLTPQIQGLCHISEFGSQKKMEEKIEMGKEYKFEILEIRPSEHRISLKLAE